MTINVSIIEHVALSNGRKHVYYELVDDANINPETKKVIIGPILEASSTDIIQKAQQLKTMFTEAAAEKELELALRDLDNGIDISNRTYSYTTKRDVLQKVYDDTSPVEQRLSNKLSTLQNIRNKIALFLGI